MKKILMFTSIIYTLSASAQRYTGWGRGLDSNISYNNNSSDSIFLVIAIIVLVIGGVINLIINIKEKIGLKTGKYVKAIRNGYIVPVSPNDVKFLSFQVLEVWKLEDFEKTFGTFKYNEERINICNKKLVSISCVKDSNITTISVNIECDARRVFFCQSDYRIAKVKNGSYYLCHSKG